MNYSWNIVYGYESRSRHGNYLPRLIVGLLVVLYSREYLFLPDFAMLLFEKAMNDYYKSIIQHHGLDMWRNWVI